MISMSTRRSPLSLGICPVFFPTLSGKLQDVLGALRLQVTMNFTALGRAEVPLQQDIRCEGAVVIC